MVYKFRLGRDVETAIITPQTRFKNILIKESDDFNWRYYSRSYYGELQALVKDGNELVIKDFSVENNELVFHDKLHNNWKEIYHQVYKLKPSTVIECGCGCGHHLINIRKTNPNILISGFDYLNSQLDIGYTKLGLKNYNFFNNLSVCNFCIPNIYKEFQPHEFVYAQAVIMHLSNKNAVDFLLNMKSIATKYIMLIDAMDDDYRTMVADIFPIPQYRRLNNLKYITQDSCILLEKYDV